jgi:hypothetical protein
MRTPFDGGRRELQFFAALAALLVLLRCALFVFRGYVDFNSDQAIVGLMAKHVSEFRAFPLFFYDQNYMLGVQAWIAAPFFWMGRPSIALLKAPLALLNIAAAILLIHGLSRRLGLRPAIAFVAALPFIMPTPVVAATFVQTLGSSGVEPLIYVLLLWMLQSRAVAFGALLAFGFLHREFTMYALPSLALVLAMERTWSLPGAARWTVRLIAGFALVWLILDYLRLHLEGVSIVSQARMLGGFVCFKTLGVFERISYIIRECVPVLFGGTVMPLQNYALRSSAVAGSPIIGWAAGGGLLVMLARAGWQWRHNRSSGRVGFAVYLALVGCAALAGYGLTCSFAYPVVRYFNLAILLPVGCFAAFAALESSTRWKQAAVALFVVWGAANLVDNVQALREAYVTPKANPHQELTDYLLSHHIRYARADYWDAYVVDFLSREQVIVASNGPARIPEYERLVGEHPDMAVNIERRMPCSSQMAVAGWCIQRPGIGPDGGGR